MPVLVRRMDQAEQGQRQRRHRMPGRQPQHAPEQDRHQREAVVHQHRRQVELRRQAAAHPPGRPQAERQSYAQHREGQQVPPPQRTLPARLPTLAPGRHQRQHHDRHAELLGEQALEGGVHRVGRAVQQDQAGAQQRQPKRIQQQAVDDEGKQVAPVQPVLAGSPRPPRQPRARQRPCPEQEPGDAAPEQHRIVAALQETLADPGRIGDEGHPVVDPAVVGQHRDREQQPGVQVDQRTGDAQAEQLRLVLDGDLLQQHAEQAEQGDAAETAAYPRNRRGQRVVHARGAFVPARHGELS